MRTLWASIYCCLGIPGAWNLWYYKLYKACEHDSTPRWVMFFINFVVSLAGCLALCACCSCRSCGNVVAVTCELFGEREGERAREGERGEGEGARESV